MSCGGGWPLNANQLNSVYDYGQFWIPAGAFTPSISEPCIITTYEGTSGAQASYTVAQFAPSVAQSANFTWAFKSDFVKVPAADISIRVAPIWYAPTTDPGPNNVVRFEAYCRNFIAGSSINSGLGGSDSMDQTVPGTAYDITGGDTSSEEDALGLTPNGAVIDPTNWNMLSFQLERHGDQAGDNFSDNVFVLGVMIQFATDFNNVALWNAA